MMLPRTKFDQSKFVYILYKYMLRLLTKIKGCSMIVHLMLEMDLLAKTCFAAIRVHGLCLQSVTHKILQRLHDNIYVLHCTFIIYGLSKW